MLSAVAGLLTVALMASASAAAILILYPILKRYALARPNARSSHVTPTPQGAGIAVIATVVVASAVGIGSHAFTGDVIASLAIIVGAAGADGVRLARSMTLPPASRYAAFAVAGFYRRRRDLYVAEGLCASSRICRWSLGNVWFYSSVDCGCYLVNFMDGIDWMTAGGGDPFARHHCPPRRRVRSARLQRFPSSGALWRAPRLCLFQSSDRQSFSRAMSEACRLVCFSAGCSFYSREAGHLAAAILDAALLSRGRQRHAIAPPDKG